MSDSDENIPYGRKFGSGFRGTRYDGTVADDVENTPIIPDDKMVVVIREDGEIGGAAGMVHPAVYDKLIKIFGTDKLIFLSSSVREFIVIPQEGSDIEMLLAAVHDINRSSVIEQERLTDNIYLMQQESGIHSHSLEVIRP